MKIKKPIFLIGSGRSGTTILYNILSLHPDTCWFSNISNKYQRTCVLAFLHNFIGLPLKRNKLKRNILKSSTSRWAIKPSEGDNIYHSYCGFKETQKTTEDDWNEKIEKKFKRIIKCHLILTGKKRFLNKQTSNTQRIRLINRMFPDAYYIHIIRDGRAVSNSYLNITWWNDLKIWWLGYTPREWEKKGKEPIELCALNWKHNVEEILRNKELFANRYLEIRYEELVKDVKSLIYKILEFCDLKISKSFLDFLPQTLPDMNNKWRKELNDHQKMILNRTLEESLTKLGYKI
jgi:hypothetical protein